MSTIMKIGFFLILGALAFTSVACDATSDGDPPGDGADTGAGSGGSGGEPMGGDGGDPPECKDPGVFSVEQAGESLEVEGLRISGEWTSLAGREVFRLRVETSHDPIPAAVDDEFALTTTIDVLGSQLLALRGEKLTLDQEISTGASGGQRSFVDDPDVGIVSGAAHARAVTRVLVEQAGFGTNPAAASYHVAGDLSLHVTEERRVQGTLKLSLEGSIPLSFAGSTQTDLEGCFDFEATAPMACLPGTECGNDCLADDEWPCSDCGTLYLTHDCKCRPDLAPLDECAAGAVPGTEGELCGEQWWCDRSCEDGLLCMPDASYANEAADADAGIGALCEHYSTCQRP